MTPVPLILDPSVWFFAGQVDESQPVRHVTVNAFPFRVGRLQNLSLTIPCPSISKEHAEILDRDGELWIQDLNSTNGTYVNGARVRGAVPLNEWDLVQFATVVFRVGRAEKAATSGNTVREDTYDRALAMIQFDRLMSDGAVVPFYQPIVSLEHGNTVGYEVLGRSRIFGLRSPKEMFSAASQLNAESELSRIFRRQGVRNAQELAPGMNVFVNTHPAELCQDGLIDSLRELRELSPRQDITLEIHEAALTDLTYIRELQKQLRDLNIQLAFDDFGAGQSRLIELVEVRPDYLKFDMQLIQGMDASSMSRVRMVRSLVKMVTDLGIVPLAEGIETEDVGDLCRHMGFQLAQGYYYGRPAAISAYRIPATA